MKTIPDLFLTFCRIGGLTFGGGYAMLPILQREVVEKKKWATEEELADYYAIGQCTPGIIAVNTATFCGYKQRGILGAASATLGVIFPSMVIIGIIAAFITNFSELAVVQNAFAGLRVCVCVLIMNTVYKLWKKSIKGWLGYGIFLLVLALSLFTDISAALLVLAAGVLGIAFAQIRKGRATK